MPSVCIAFDLSLFRAGIKGWYALGNAHRAETADLSEHCVGGLELFVRFGQQDDRRRVIDSAKSLGWLDDNYVDEENFLDGLFSRSP